MTTIGGEKRRIHVMLLLLPLMIMMSGVTRFGLEHTWPVPIWWSHDRRRYMIELFRVGWERERKREYIKSGGEGEGEGEGVIFKKRKKRQENEKGRKPFLLVLDLCLWMKAVRKHNVSSYSLSSQKLLVVSLSLSHLLLLLSVHFIN